MTEEQARQKAVDMLLPYLGAVQGDARHLDLLRIYNAFRPLPLGYVMTPSDAWCAATVSLPAIVLGWADIAPPECSCSRMIALYQKHAGSRWEEDDAYVPRPGDLIFYDWSDVASGFEGNDCRGAPDHVGMVEMVEGMVITVIEGNYSKSVKRRSVRVNGRYIRGFALPAYYLKADVAGAAPAPEKPKEGLVGMDFEEFYKKLFAPAMDRYRRECAKLDPADWSEEAREWAESEEVGLVLGVGGPGDMQYKTYATREMMAVFFYRMFNLFFGKGGQQGGR
ncbi:MAG: CHAP domain-containing protein [Oscillospiraceae bacterium]|nr:CHAP domain-containing protein [Oscillospiraceae bacterium]